MREDATDEQIAAELSDFFSEVTDTLPPLENQYEPLSGGIDWPLINEAEVCTELKNLKKPKSVVKGDILPNLVNPLILTLFFNPADPRGIT